jgi:uncharacterized protein YqeY
MASELKQRIQTDVTAAMRAKDKARLSALRLVTAAIKQVEVDSRSELDDAGVLLVLEKMLKQRRDSLEQYESAGRTDLADQERFEIDIIEAYMPEALPAEELEALIPRPCATWARSWGCSSPASRGAPTWAPSAPRSSRSSAADGPFPDRPRPPTARAPRPPAPPDRPRPPTARAPRPPALPDLSRSPSFSLEENPILQPIDPSTGVDPCRRRKPVAGVLPGLTPGGRL